VERIVSVVSFRLNHRGWGFAHKRYFFGMFPFELPTNSSS
jgi:hypothetical protein